MPALSPRPVRTMDRSRVASGDDCRIDDLADRREERLVRVGERAADRDHVGVDQAGHVGHSVSDDQA